MQYQGRESSLFPIGTWKTSVISQWIRFEEDRIGHKLDEIKAAQQDATSVEETTWQYEVLGDYRYTMQEMEQCDIFLRILWWPNTSSN